MQGKQVDKYQPDPGYHRVLLINPPAYDTRFPWSQWQQPITLLQLSTLLKRLGCDVRLLDALHRKTDDRLRRQRADVIHRGDVQLNFWRFGTLRSEFDLKMRAWAREKWVPDAVYIEGGTTFWWQGVREVADLVRLRFPSAQIVLCGVYPKCSPAHAAGNVDADVVVTGDIDGLAGLALDLSLYPSRPIFSHVLFGPRERGSDEIISEVLDKVTHASGAGRVTRVAFADHDIATTDPERFRAVLQGIARHNVRATFYALGTLHPRSLASNPDLARLMKDAGYKQIVLSDDRDQPMTEAGREEWLDLCRIAIESCERAGFQVRTEAVSAMISVGRLHERLEDVAAYMTRLAHVAGSIIPVPYQPKSEERPEDMSLEKCNGKVFPLAEANGTTYREYQDLLGLAALFNSKYRSRTFDFSGDSLIARLLQESLASGRWDPRSTEEGRREKPVVLGWFNKEGKWVRS